MKEKVTITSDDTNVVDELVKDEGRGAIGSRGEVR